MNQGLDTGFLKGEGRPCRVLGDEGEGGVKWEEQQIAWNLKVQDVSREQSIIHSVVGA